MSRVTMIQHINIQISDRERTREWYEKVLGAEFPVTCCMLGRRPVWRSSSCQPHADRSTVGDQTQ